MPTYTANSPEGRMLLALRAGPMSTAELTERFPCGHRGYTLRRRGLAVLADEVWSLTPAGRDACPLRNPLSATVTPPPSTPGESDMPRSTPQQSHTDKIRLLLQKAPDGLSRKEILQRLDLPESSVDNAICLLVRRGEAMRPRYGVIAATATLTPIEGALMPSSPSDEKPARPKKQPEIPPTEVDFSVYADGRLAIIDGDEILVLKPEDTRRLGQFLGCFDPSTWQQRPAARPLPV